MSTTHTHIESNTLGSIQDVPVPKPKILCFTLAEVQMRHTLLCLDSVLLEIPVSVLLISCKGLRDERQSSSPARETEGADLGTKLGCRGQGRGLWVKMRSEEGDGGSRGQSTFSHLYSPKVQSSSFMGWNSGSVWASSFSLTGEERTWSSGKSDYDQTVRMPYCISFGIIYSVVFHILFITKPHLELCSCYKKTYFMFIQYLFQQGWNYNLNMLLYEMSLMTECKNLQTSYDTEALVTKIIKCPLNLIGANSEFDSYRTRCYWISVSFTFKV